MAEEIGAVGAERHPTLLADFLHTGTQAAEAPWNPTAKKLETDEVAEISYIEIFSPMTGAGVIEDLKQVIPVIDDKGIEEYVSLSGRYDSNMMPPRLHLCGGQSPLQTERILISFGEPAVENPLRNTTLKAKEYISIRTYAGATDVTQDYRIRIYGFLYKTEAEAREVYGDSVYGAEAALIDVNRGKRLTITKGEVEISKEKWDMLVGGVRQSKPMIMPMMRYAYNAKATTPSVDYEFDYKAGDVDNTWENLYFEYGVAVALFVRGFGVRSPTNLKYMGIKLGDRIYPKPDHFRVDSTSNPLHFGHGRPLFPEDFPLFIPIPTLPYGYMINNEKGRIIVKDNGTSIAIDDIIVAMQGIKVEL